jgi:hypothetical protein
MIGARLVILSPTIKTPLQLPHCVLWLDAADPTTITTATGVSQWNNKVPSHVAGSAGNAAQATGGAQPAYITAGRNGKNVLRFDGANHFMAVADFALTSFVTFIVVAKSNSTSTQQHMLRKGLQTGVSLEYTMRLNADASSSASYTNSGGTNAAVSMPAAADLNWNVWTARWNLNEIVHTKNRVHRVATALTGTALFNGSTSLRIGSGFVSVDDDSSAINTPWNGDIGEIVICNGYVTDHDLASVGRYLSPKWGIAL